MLSQQTSFPKLMRMLRQGSADAAEMLVQLCEPTIQHTVRHYLRHHALRREIDPQDISQMVLATFFLRNSAARCELNNFDELTSLLVRMAKNKVRDQVRKLHARRRDARRLDPSDCLFDTVVNRDATPSKIAAGKELVQEIHRRLSADERQLAEQRLRGLEWTEIAELYGDSPEALRKKLARAIERVRQELHL